MRPGRLVRLLRRLDVAVAPFRRSSPGWVAAPSLLSDALDRLTAAGLLPPVTGGSQLVEGFVVITATEGLSAETIAEVDAVLEGIPHRIEQEPPGHGVLYGGR